jgi:hypothetical protein
MIRIVTKENKKILFSKQEIKFSTLLNNLFFNDDEEDEEDKEDKEDEIIEFKIQRVSIESFTKIKNIFQYIINNKLEINDELYNNYNLNKFIEISPTFTIQMFFKFLDTVNFLHINVIIKLMCNSIKEDISYLYISGIEKKFNLNKNELNDKSKLRLKLFEKIIYKDG